jgi:two-component system alkaline phosphatase synthesis response regulator PhoP
MNPGKILTRQFILKEIWGDEIFVVDRTIDVHIRKIREKLDKYEYFIQTIKGVGYKLIDETEIEEYQQ